MSARHPIIAITGSSGAGTTSVSKTFEQIFRRERVKAVFVEGDAFHRYDRAEMATRMVEESASGNRDFSHFGSDANLFAELEQLFRDYGEDAGGRMRRYVHTDEGGQAAGTFTDWGDVPPDSELLFYEGLHGAVVTDGIDIARHVDLLIGVVPVINLEWIQKLHRDKTVRAHSTESVTDTILRRMPDYLNFIVPQFTKTHINFQRVPVVDTSNPFIARFIPTLDESFLVVRFRDPRGIDFAYLLQMLAGSFMSRANTLVCPGGKMDLAMQLIFTPMIWRLMERRTQAIQR
ncbi:MAG: phosphoribulokinase [Chloroflexi bacterium]|nr:phosphoribulokinase [Chloroflexota bacterium]MBA3741323.1 phosphoribulokinase [Chloroflexota bacterium]